MTRAAPRRRRTDPLAAKVARHDLSIEALAAAVVELREGLRHLQPKRKAGVPAGLIPPKACAAPHEATIRKWCVMHGSDIGALLVDSHWFVDPDKLAAFLAKRRDGARASRPRKR